MQFHQQLAKLRGGILFSMKYYYVQYWYTPMTRKRYVAKFSFQTIQKRNRLKIRSYRRYGENGEKTFFLTIICSRFCTRRNLRFHVKNCQHADQKQLTRRLAFDLDIESTHGQPALCRARPVNVDDGLEDIRWIRGLGGEKLPAVSYALPPNLKKSLFFAIGEGSRNFVACFLHSSACVCIRRLAGARHVSQIVS